ncbi:MAG: hypothetical protein AAB740_01865 [Patescibacteria group bacterium]
MMQMTLQEIMDYFFRLYGRRNRIFLSGLDKRINYLSLGICDLQDAIRKEQNSEIIGAAFARVTARIFCIVEHFWSLPLVEAMSQKYPMRCCSYCQSFPCKCAEKRPDVIVGSVSGEQLTWSLRQWQQHFNALYGEKNRQKGMDNVLNRLFKEVGELLSLLMMIPNTNLKLSEIEKEFALELADALAWVIALANLLGVDIEQAIVGRYGNGCWRCHQNSCICANFDFKPMKWDN